MARASLTGIYKRFGGIAALAGAELELGEREVHALLGENGAGKTTLVRVLYGLVRPDAGVIRLDAQPVQIRGPRHALELGIGLVHQHFMGVPALSVAENLVLGDPGSLWLPRARLHAEARARLEEHGLELDPGAPVAALSVGERQRLEITRALARGAQILILDEPTAVLAPSEVTALLALIARLREQGRTVVFISHKLEEITRVCDRVTVLRAGRTVATRTTSQLDAEALGRLMVGDEPPPPGRPPESEPGEVALRLAGLRCPGLDGLDAEVRAGEILSVAGIDGNGQGPLEQVLAGVQGLDAGSVEIRRPPLALLSADRQHTGLVLELSVAENLILPEAANASGPVFRGGLLQRDVLAHGTAAAIDHWRIRGSAGALARELSGGNQQKLAVARALRGDPGVIVALNPTRGLDLGAAAFVRDELRALARQGRAVLLVSTDLDEVLELGHRIAVLFRGKLLPVPAGGGREQVGALMLGESAE